MPFAASIFPAEKAGSGASSAGAPPPDMRRASSSCSGEMCSRVFDFAFSRAHLRHHILAIMFVSITFASRSALLTYRRIGLILRGCGR